MTNNWARLLLILGIFLPRLIVPDDFFIQDEQPWIDRSQSYVNSLFSGDFSGAVRYPLSNHPAIPLMTTVGPVMSMYASYHDLDGTYADWSLDNKRDAAVWARYTWGIVCSFALLALYACLRHLRIFGNASWQAGLIVILLGLEPWILGISRSVSVDVLMAISVVGMLVSAVIAFERRAKPWAFISGVWFGVAFTSKSPALITAPLAFFLAIWVMHRNWKEIGIRALYWLAGAYVAIIIIWPPFLFHPISRITDVLARAELHSTVQEVYDWPGFHPPLFVFTLSAFATIGCFLYLWMRITDLRKYGWKFSPLDIILLAGLWHGALLLYLNGDHARKNLPVLALLGFVGALGWVLFMNRRNAPKVTTILGVLILQSIFILPYFPHTLSAYNALFPSSAGKRLLVDVGNGSVLVADFINQQSLREVFSVSMDSLVLPYVDGDKRKNIRSLPAGGKLESLDPEVTYIIVPASMPARIQFDSDGKMLLAELSRRKPERILSVRDVPMFLVYSINHARGI